MTRCSDAHTFSLLHERTNHASARKRFAGSWRALNSQNRVVEFVCDTDRELHGRLSVAGSEWNRSKRRRVGTQQPLNECRAVAGGNSFAGAKDRILQDLGRHMGVRKKRCWLRFSLFLS